MRSMRSRTAPLDSGMLVSPGEIIARAAATVPERAPEVEVARRNFAPATGGEVIVIPPPPPLRRARRRPSDMLRRGWFYGSRGALAAALLLVVAGGPLWLLRSGILATAERSAAETYQSLRRGAEADFAIQLDGFTVHGRNRTSREAVRGALQIRRGDSLLAMDPWVIKRRLETLPWVRTATVTRRFPNTVVIELVERTPVARYRDRSGTVLVDNAGAIIPVAAEREHENLVLLAGEGAPAAANSLLKLLEQEPALARRVVMATRYGNRRWDLLFDGGTVLRLPDGYEKAAITKFGEFERAHNLLSRGAVTYDMRLPDRLVVRSQREPAPAAPPSEKTPPAKKARKTG